MAKSLLSGSRRECPWLYRHSMTLLAAQTQEARLMAIALPCRTAGCAAGCIGRGSVGRARDGPDGDDRGPTPFSTLWKLSGPLFLTKRVVIARSRRLCATFARVLLVTKYRVLVSQPAENDLRDIARHISAQLVALMTPAKMMMPLRRPSGGCWTSPKIPAGDRRTVSDPSCLSGCRERGTDGLGPQPRRQCGLGHRRCRAWPRGWPDR